MLGIAFVGALVVFTVDARREATAQRDSSPTLQIMKWVNLSANDAANPAASWTEIILNSLGPESADLINLATEGAKSAELNQRLLFRDRSARIDIATVWVGPEDLLAGTPLNEFEQQFASLLQQLDSFGAIVVVGNVPNLTPELVAAQLAKHDAVQAVIAQWNGSIARLIAAAGGALVDLHDSPRESANTLHFLSGTNFLPDEAAQDFIAQRFAMAMATAIEERSELSHQVANTSQ
jgi:hypothetical protein